jgi:hypothetical protein
VAQLMPPFVHSRPRTFDWSRKVDGSSGSEVAARQGLAELLIGEKNRCILVIAPVTAPASDRAPVPGPGRDNFRDNRGDNRVRVSRDVVYT